MTAHRIAAILLLWIGICRAERAELPPVLPPVDVWIEDAVNTRRTLDLHKTLVSSLFAEIGVQIRWHSPGDRRREAGDPGFEITVVRQALEATPERALASTRISESAITVFGDRVRQSVSQSHPSVASVLTGYVIAHELAHAIQGIPRHSGSGILKAEWSNHDLTGMLFQKLKFNEFDARLIRQRAGLSSPAGQLRTQAGTGSE